MTRSIACAFLRRLIEAVPYRIHTILTDNGIQFTNQTRHKYAFKHLFDRICSDHGIDHRLTKPNHPWTHGQVDRMNRTLKEASIYRSTTMTATSSCASMWPPSCWRTTLPSGSIPSGDSHPTSTSVSCQLLPDESEELAPGTTALKLTSVSEAFGILRNALPRMFTAAM